MSRFKSDVERFKANSSPATDGTDCVLWTAYKDKKGYGRCRVAGRVTRSHRAAWRLFVGPIPDWLHVCHSCDRPPCVNLSHLFLGTARDNTHDMVRKGR